VLCSGDSFIITLSIKDFKYFYDDQDKEVEMDEDSTHKGEKEIYTRTSGKPQVK
jgi:hypothetical protein